MNKLLLSILLLTGIASKAQTLALSPRAEISIITFAPWQEEVFTAFGHSAIRVYDPDHRLDDAYNYGVFDFDQPNFYVNFARGIPYYKLGVFPYPDFRDYYIFYKRSVTEQVLDLSPAQKQAVYNYLEWNALPEHENYRYDYFYNNCATKIRDVFAEVLKDSIQFDSSFVKTDYSIRDLTDIYLKHQPWGDLGIDICLGLPMDKKATPWDYMFLPDYIELSFDHVTIAKPDGAVPIVKEKRFVYDGPIGHYPMRWNHPWFIFGGFLVLTIALSWYDIRRKKLSKWFDVPLFTLVGLIGILLLLLWTVTNHKAASTNFNFLWAVPSNILILWIFSAKSSSFVKKYFLGVTILEVILLMTWSFLPQHLNMFLLPFVAALTLRAFTIQRLL